MKEPTDQSTQAWAPLSIVDGPRSAFAQHLIEFSLCRAENVVPLAMNAAPYAVTNKGLQINLPILPFSRGRNE